MSRYLLLPLLMIGLLIAPVVAQVAKDTTVVRKSAPSCAEMYPPLAARLEQEGTTSISGVIKTDGTVGNIRISKSSGFPLLDQAAMACVATWRYQPAKRNGIPVEVPANPQIVWKLAGPNLTPEQRTEMTSLSNALSNVPGDTVLLLKRARLFTQINQYRAALADYQRILNIKPRDVSVLIAMGRLQAARHDPQARQTLDKAVEYSNASTEALEARGDYLMQSELHLARADYSEILTRNPSHVDVRVKRAMVLANLKLTDAARNELDLLLKVDSDTQAFRRALGMRAVLAEINHKYGAAIQDRDRLAQLDPNPSNINNACWVRGIANRELSKGESLCLRAIKLAPNGAYVHDSLGMIYFRMNKPHQALNMYNKAIALAPRQAASLFMRGVIKNRLGIEGGAADIAEATKLHAEVATRFSEYGILP